MLAIQHLTELFVFWSPEVARAQTQPLGFSALQHRARRPMAPRDGSWAAAQASSTASTPSCQRLRPRHWSALSCTPAAHAPVRPADALQWPAQGDAPSRGGSRAWQTRKRAHLTHPPPHLEDGAAAHTTCLEMICDAASETQRIQIIAMAPECQQ